MNSILTTTIPNSRNWLLTKPYAAIDTEFKINYEIESKPYTLYAASIVDNTGFVQFRHITDFHSHQPEKELVKWLMGQMLGFHLTMGWYSKGAKLTREDGSIEGKDSDLKVIDSVCKYYDIPSIIGFNQVGVPFVRGYDSELCKIDQTCALWNRFRRYYHIDLFQVYKKPVVKAVIYNNIYRSLRLGEVCLSIIGEGKLEGLDGSQVQKLSKEKQLEYVTQDARLVMKLSQHNDYEILDLMNAVSTIIDVPFERVCHTGISTWWKKIIQDKIVGGDCRAQDAQIKKRKYLGGYVIEPKVGFYDKQPVYVLDVKSLYPTMMIANNISFDTVNCDCCKNYSEAKVDREIMDVVNSGLTEREKRECYWICRNPEYRGIVPRLLQQFRDERFKHEEADNEPMQLALKNLINGCYGVFGSNFFEFADYRVAELTTAFGRQTLQYMQHIAKKVYDFAIIYGDTDSLFVTHVKKENDIMKFIAECSILLDIDVEQSNLFKKFLITKKKHYIGIPLDESRQPLIKGMEGIKSDRPPWINNIERKFADDIKYGNAPIVNIRKEYEAMESGQVPLEDLQIKLTLAKNPDEYGKNSLQRIIGTELGASRGDTIKYYKSNTAGGGTSNPNLISRTKYLQILKTTVENSLQLMEYDYFRDVIGSRNLQDYTIQVSELPCTLPSSKQSSSRSNTNTSKRVFDLDIRSLIKCQTIKQDGYTYIPCTPAKGVLYITDDNPIFISGQIRMRGRDEGRYPYNYLEMIDSIFGPEYNTVEVCSRSIPGINHGGSCFTIDINPKCNPDLVTDGQVLQEIPDNKFNRWRCDPPYNEITARKMYGTSLPKTSKLLKAGARVCKPGSLMFLLLGAKNYQPCPLGVKRIGMITISVIPNNELRILNVFYKVK